MTIPRGKPLQPRFPKEPHHRRAANDSLMAKSRKYKEGIHRRGDGGSHVYRTDSDLSPRADPPFSP